MPLFAGRWNLRFQTKNHDFVGKGPPWGGESSFALIPGEDSYLVVTKKTINKGQHLAVGARIYNMGDELGRKIVFGTCKVEIVKVSTYPNGVA